MRRPLCTATLLGALLAGGPASAQDTGHVVIRGIREGVVRNTGPDSAMLRALHLEPAGDTRTVARWARSPFTDGGPAAGGVISCKANG